MAAKPEITIKRIYERPSDSDGQRVLIDRLWPRGIKKEDARLTLWLKEIAPSNELRKWYGHDPELWDEFQKRYRTELKDKGCEVKELRSLLAKGKVTLLYSSHEERYNNAVALEAYLKETQ